MLRRSGVHGPMNEPLHLTPLPADAVEQPARSFEDLVEAESAGLFGALCLITRDRYEAEDVMQEAFLKVWERWDRVAGHGRSDRLPLPDGAEPVSPAPAARLPGAPACDAPRSSAATSSPRSRRATRSFARSRNSRRGSGMSVVLVDLLDYSSEEAARVMGIKAATVRVLASQGRAALKRNVGDRR